MDEQKPIPSEARSTEPEAPIASRGLSPGAGGARLGGPARRGQQRQAATEPQRLEIVVRLAPAEPQQSDPPKPVAEVAAEPTSVSPTATEPVLTRPADSLTRPTGEGKVQGRDAEPQQIPARMLNEFVYCQRLFYYEFVEGVFVESADTLRGGAIHQRVDSGTGAVPKAKRKSEADKPKEVEGTTGDAAQSASKETESQNTQPETIHSRSVQMGSERLGVVAKMDLVETKAEKEDLFTALEVCPVDYKAGAPKEGEEANELWDTDKMQLGLQALILRDNGYTCNEGIIYYRATKQRVRLPITPELESWILQNIAEARRVAAGPIPAPLVNSPKCVRCSLAPVCLPDETRMLARQFPRQASDRPLPSDGRGVGGEGQLKVEVTLTPGIPVAENAAAPRRLMAPRDDTRPLYLNTQGFRVGCKDE